MLLVLVLVLHLLDSVLTHQSELVALCLYSSFIRSL